MTKLSQKQEELCEQDEWDFSHLKALFINTTLKLSPEVSNTQGLIDVSAEIMRRQGVAIDEFRAVDHDIPPGVWPDMTATGTRRTSGQVCSSGLWTQTFSYLAPRSGSARNPRFARGSSNGSMATPPN